MSVQIYLTATPDKLPEAARFTDRLAHVAYRVGRDGQLTRHSLLGRTQGGLMVLGDRDCGPIRNRDVLCHSVWRECAQRGFLGLVADFEQAPSPDRAAFLGAMGQILRRNGKRLFVPERYGGKVPGATVLLCTAVSGGTLRQRLEEGIGRFGRERVALDLQRLRMDFPLPCPSGEGTALTGEALQALVRQQRPAVFYSADLCAKYFTLTREGKRRFILFDDGDTLLRKIQVGNSLGITTGFLMFPEVADLLPQLFGKQQSRRPQGGGRGANQR